MGGNGLSRKSIGVGASPGAIISHLSFTAAASVEARKGRLGIYADYLYLGDQDGVYTSGLISKLDLKFNETIADLDVSWRVLESPRGWVDVLAGARYMNVYSRIQLHSNETAIASASQGLVEVASANVRNSIETALNESLQGNNSFLPVYRPSANQLDQLTELINAAKNDPELAAAIKTGVSARIAQEKQRVANRIASILSGNLNRAFSLNHDWLDPYIGLRARYNLTKAFYLTAKADVGGFGVGSQVSCEAIAALGCQITRRIWSELGYKYLYVDYSRSDFVYNISTGGALLTALVPKLHLGAHLSAQLICCACGARPQGSFFNYSTCRPEGTNEPTLTNYRIE